MSTLTLGNPIQVTGPLATSYKTQLAAAAPNAGKNNSSYGTLSTLIFQKLRWVNPGASNTLSIGDPLSGGILFLMKSNTAGEDVEIDMDANPVLISDFEINSFVAGSTLLIWTR